MLERFKDLVAVVTGGGNGIGAAVCRRLSSEGARVVVADTNKGAAERTAKGLKHGLAVQVLTCRYALELSTSERVVVLLLNLARKDRPAFRWSAFSLVHCRLM